MSQGRVRRTDKEMSRGDAEALLLRARLAYFATVGAEGDPYVVPNLFVYAERRIYLHTAHTPGHFRRNFDHVPRISFTVAETGEVFPYGAFACDTSISYASVIGIGRASLEEDAAAKARFFDRFLAKYAGTSWGRPEGFYPRLDQVTVYRIDPDWITGKCGPLPPLAAQWPQRNDTRSPGAIPPGGGG